MIQHKDNIVKLIIKYLIQLKKNINKINMKT